MTALPSLVRGEQDPPLIEHTIGQALKEASRLWGDMEALVFPAQDIRWTYSALDAIVDDIAAGFIALGLAPGERIGIWATNNAEWTVTQFAAARIGLILVTINPAYRVSELAYTLNKAGIAALVLTEAFKSSNYVDMMLTFAPEIMHSEGGRIASPAFPDLRHVILIGDRDHPGFIPFWTLGSLGAAGHREEVKRIAATLGARDPINVQFTSGTTGSPKGATLSHRNILNNGWLTGRGMTLEPGDRLCIPVPLYHCFGMVMANLACVSHGATMVFTGAAFDAPTVLDIIERERCTALHGVPTMFIAELEEQRRRPRDLFSLRTGVMAGAPCPIELMREVIDQMHLVDITIAYGMTETSPVSFQTRRSDSITRRVSSIGQVMPHVEVKIVDADGNIVPRGEPGELCTRGYSVMLGYWGDPERTAESIDADGWMHSGDIGVIDEQGYGNIVGRIKDMIIRGGENIYPREIEEFLIRHPAIADVHVIGVPDEKFGEELCAWIRIAQGETLIEEEVKAFCSGQIAHYKVPHHIRFVDEFPMTVTGKIQKFAMRETMCAELEIRQLKTA